MSAPDVPETVVIHCLNCGIETEVPCSYPQNRDQTPWCDEYIESSEEYCKQCAIFLAEEDLDNVDYEIKSRKEADI